MNEIKKTAGESGWHLSRYNLSAEIPGTDSAAIANLFRGTCAAYNPLELYLLSVLDSLPEDHPIIPRFAKRGIIARFDERAALETLGRAACASSLGVTLTICPTMNCNFDCPYCFEHHRPGKMSREVQDDVVALAERMLDVFGRTLRVIWFGGEPLLAADVIESLSESLMTMAKKKGAVYSAGIITNGYLLTQKNVDLLKNAGVTHCQVTLDGLGTAHNATRRLAGGGATFERIIGNLRSGKIPFRVHIRQNVQKSNLDKVPEVRAFVRRLAGESGNWIDYAPAPVTENKATEERGGEVRYLCEHDCGEIGLLREVSRFRAGQGHYCGADTMRSVVIDEKGKLFKCWENAGDPDYAFGSAHDWTPKDPVNTAFAPDKLTMYLNTALPNGDLECDDCVWLPLCSGGCPKQRLLGRKACFSLRNQPEKFVLAHRHIRTCDRRPRSRMLRQKSVFRYAGLALHPSGYRHRVLLDQLCVHQPVTASFLQPEECLLENILRT